MINTPTDIHPTRDILTVSRLNMQARLLLETHLPLIWVEGEISNLAQPSSGHWYFTLKDAKAQVRCAMFRNRNQSLRFKPEHGQKILLRARVSLYEGRGEYQLIAEHMEDVGAGLLQKEFEALKHTLEKEGLFRPEGKKSIPALPHHIGIITSPTGAAIHDIIAVLKRRFASIPITIIPVAVQGKSAAKEIVKALNTANNADLFDVIILCRGGGSLEDLWSFNEEIVARAIYKSSLPVISAVGHEIDFSIADFVADMRAATPSAAAEIVAPDSHTWILHLEKITSSLHQSLNQRLKEKQNTLQHLQQRLRHPGVAIRMQSQRLDQLEIREKNAIKHKLTNNKERFNLLIKRQLNYQPKKQIINTKKMLALLNSALSKTIKDQLHRHKQQLIERSRALHNVSPLETLQRGYAVATTYDDKLIQDSKAINVGDTIQVRFSSGKITSEVKKIIE